MDLVGFEPDRSFITGLIQTHLWLRLVSHYLLMVQRHFWQKLVEQNWHERSVVWLAGVRRVGKTFLCQSLHDIEYFDCELPRMRRLMEDAQAFLEGLGKRRIILDEVHRLPNSSSETPSPHL